MKTLLFNGLVHTPDDPGASAVLVDGDRIAWVGHEGAALAQRDGVDREIDLQGALLTPAFVDAHVHVTATGMNLGGLDLTESRGAADLLDRVTRFCADVPPGDVVLGHGWDETTWSDQTLPNRTQIDRAAGGVAVYLTRIDVHSAIASTPLLELVPDVSGSPGFDSEAPLRSDAHHAARRAVLDGIGEGQRARLQRGALDHFSASGVAAVHEMAGPDISSERDLRALLSQESGPLVTAYWGELGSALRARELRATGAGGDLFADGAIGSHTAFLSVPYADSPDTRGVRHVTAAEVTEHVADCTAAGIQAGFHVIGDAALAEVLAGFRRAADRWGADRIRAGRHRLEHVEMPTAGDLATMAELGLTASVQPQFDALWGESGGMYEMRLGAERAQSMNPFSAFIRAGIPLAFGSDTPVTPVTPWHSVSSAMFHHTGAARVSARAAFHAHTRGGWRAIGVDDAGVIRPGTAAHLAVWKVGEMAVQTPDERVAAWSTDPRSGTPPLPLLTAGGPFPKCLLTMSAGRVTHSTGSLV